VALFVDPANSTSLILYLVGDIMSILRKRVIVLAIVASFAAGCGGGGGSGSTGSTGGTTPTGNTGGTGTTGGTGGTGTTGGTTDTGNTGGTGGTTGTGTTGNAPDSDAVGTAVAWHSAIWGGGGYVTGVIFHPTTANVYYARTDVGGAYRWNSANSSWTPITDGVGFGGGEGRFHGIESLALDPNNDQLVYMATGVTTTWGAGNGRLYVSSDRGNSWTHYDMPFQVGGNDDSRGYGERLALDPNKPSILFYGSRKAGLWKSTDSGQNWTQATGLTSFKIVNSNNSAIGIEQVLFDTSTKGSGTATQTIYASVASDYGKLAGLTANLYKSTDGGTTWASVSVPSTVSGFYIPHMVRSADGSIYMVFNQNAGQGATGPGYLYRLDADSSWHLLKSSTASGMGGLSVSGSGSTARIAVGMTGWNDTSKLVQLSDDGGASWHEIEAGMPHTDGDSGGCVGWNEDVKIDPANRDHIMHIHGGGICETRDASSKTPTWSGTVSNLEETVTQAMITPPAGASYKLVNSAGDIGTWVVTDLATKPTKSPYPTWSNGFTADILWSDPTYIVGAGVKNSSVESFGFWSGDGGNTWKEFASVPADAVKNQGGSASIVTTARNNIVWAPSDSVPIYTTNNGANWTATNLPALAGVGINRGYRLVVDRKNPNKVYAYDSGGATWGTAGKVYVSTDAGHTFTPSQGAASLNLAPNGWWSTSLVVNPNAEGDVWLADGNAVYHSTDSGATWTKLSGFATVAANGTRDQQDGASVIALGKAKAGAAYSAAVYVVGTRNGQWGVYRSDDGGATWTRFNDDAHQFGGVGAMAADWNTYGRIYVNGAARGIQYSN
jgi:hypothetical protein